MRAPVALLASLAAALGLHLPASQAATAEELARVQQRLQEAAAPWCERLSERAADGRKRCTIQIQAIAADRALAFSLLGHVVITQPMLVLLTEPELALVGGHEIAHLVLGHALTGMEMAGMPAATVPMLESRTVPPHEDAPKDRLQMELDADRLGLFFAGLAGYPVRQLAAGWPTLIGRLPLKPPTGADNTHPSSEMRVRQLRDAADEFCTSGQRSQALMPAPERLQPRHEADVDALRERQAQLPIFTICRLPASP